MKKIITGPMGHPPTRSVLRSVRRQGAVLAVLATGLTFALGTSASAVSTTPVPGPTPQTGVGSHIATTGSRPGGVQSPTSGVANAGRSPLVAPVAQSPLILTSTSGVVGTALTLTSSGGSGTGAVTYGVTNTGTAGCFITSDRLNATKAGTCTVTVTKAADATYLAASSPATTVTFAAAPLKVQSPLTLTSTSGVLGTALTLTSSGGSGTGTVTYDVTNAGTAGCSVKSGKLDATRLGTCTVTVTKAADTTYLAASSPATTVTFAAAPLKVQSPLTLTSTSGVVGTTLTLTSSGGSGTGAVTYGVTNTGTAGCWIANGGLNATRAGTCTVTVTKAGDATYQDARSSATPLVFQVKVVPVQLRATRVNGIVWAGRTSIVTITGSGFYGKPRIWSNQARTTATVIHDYGHALVVRVTLAPRSAPGWHVFTISLANGHRCQVRYMVK